MRYNYRVDLRAETSIEVEARDEGEACEAATTIAAEMMTKHDWTVESISSDEHGQVWDEE